MMDIDAQREWGDEIIPVSEATRTFTAAQDAEYRALKDAINLAIREKFDGRRAYVDVPKYPSARIQARLEAACSKAGWVVEFHDDQRDGPSATVRPATAEAER